MYENLSGDEYSEHPAHFSVDGYEDAYPAQCFADGYGAAEAAYPADGDGFHEQKQPCTLPMRATEEDTVEALAPIPHEPDPKKPLRLLYAGPHFAVGGVEQHAVSLAKFLNPKRVQMAGYVITSHGKPAPRSAASAPFPVRAAGPGDLSESVRDCDVLLMWGAAFNGRFSRARPLSVFMAHGELWWSRKGLLDSHLVTDHVVAVSNRVKQRVCHGFPTTTIANGVDSSRLGQTRSAEVVREQLGFSPSDFVLGSLGRFSKEKRMDLLIEAVALLPPTFKLLLVGDGPRRAELLDLANERIPRRYAFVRAHDYLGDYYRAMDAFCLASSNEGFALVVPEAMLCDRPVIATNVGCIPEVIQHRVSGLVVEGTTHAFAKAAMLLHSHPHWMRGIAAEGRIFADRHLHAARMARDFENLLLKLHRTRSAEMRGSA